MGSSGTALLDRDRFCGTWIDHGLDMPRPSKECGAFFVGECVSLIHANHACQTAAYVMQAAFQ